MNTRYLGIDPGVNGGLVCLTTTSIDGSGEIVNSCRIPEGEKTIWRWFEWIKEESEGGKIYACIEELTGYVGIPGKGNSSSKLMQSYGALRMALTGNGIEFTSVRANVWQRSIGMCPRKKNSGDEETDSEWKNRLKDKAKELFPFVNVTLAISDALLIAYYCRKINTIKE